MSWCGIFRIVLSEKICVDNKNSNSRGNSINIDENNEQMKRQQNTTYLLSTPNTKNYDIFRQVAQGCIGNWPLWCIMVESYSQMHMHNAWTEKLNAKLLSSYVCERRLWNSNMILMRIALALVNCLFYMEYKAFRCWFIFRKIKRYLHFGILWGRAQSVPWPRVQLLCKFYLSIKSCVGLKPLKIIRCQ